MESSYLVVPPPPPSCYLSSGWSVDRKALPPPQCYKETVGYFDKFYNWAGSWSQRQHLMRLQQQSLQLSLHLQLTHLQREEPRAWASWPCHKPVPVVAGHAITSLTKRQQQIVFLLSTPMGQPTVYVGPGGRAGSMSFDLVSW